MLAVDGEVCGTNITAGWVCWTNITERYFLFALELRLGINTKLFSAKPLLAH